MLPFTLSGVAGSNLASVTYTIGRNYQKFSRAFQGLFRRLAGNFASSAVFGRRSRNGQADEDHHRDRFFVDPAQPQFPPRVVSTVRDRSGHDRAGRGWSDLKLTTAGAGGMAQFGRAAPHAGTRWLDADLPEFASGSRAENISRLTAACRGGKREKGDDMKSRLHFKVSSSGLLALLVLPVGLSAQAPKPAHYTVTDLGTLGGSGTNSTANEINNAGLGGRLFEPNCRRPPTRLPLVWRRRSARPRHTERISLPRLQQRGRWSQFEWRSSGSF